MKKTAQYWIEKLELLPHPEGGFYKETYRSESRDGARAAATEIYFLIQSNNVSKFHRIDADEMWHFFAGDPLNVHMIDQDGEYDVHRLGPIPDKGQVFQAVVPTGVWFGADVAIGGDYSLVGCTVAPGFEFSGFELAERNDLTRRFPEHDAIIKRLT